MTSERLQRAHDLFDEALKRPAPERAAFLARASGDDVELRAQVEALLEHDRQAGEDFMRPPESKSQAFEAALAAAEKRPDPLIGRRIGRYQVQSIIAAGGMGTVYEALQEQPRRTVALKVMNRNVASRSALRRFQFESQILAHLRHPNIAQIFEAGVHHFDPSPDHFDPSRDRERAVLADAVPYFAMEYVPDAKRITQYAEEKQLDTGRRLELFAQVCDAVHHGHQKGVIHRDLKPANILIDSSGRPKVIDFGVARGTDADLSIKTQQTRTGQFVGTMQYMSPEQCDADPHDLDTRSDVYSLGVVLYELLTGELPYDASKSTIYQATRVIKEEAPRRLSAINPRLRGDVETIVLKALDKDREKRYQSAVGLAQDIRRHLRREPIEASPPTVWMKGVRWVARRPIAATTTACLAIFFVGLLGTFLTIWVLKSRPYELVPSEDGKMARLVSVGGSVIHEWRAGADGKITFAQLVRRPASQGGGALAVLGFNEITQWTYGDDLCVFDPARSLVQPAWSRGIEPDDVPESIDAQDVVRRRFSCVRGALFDIFPETEDLEIVAVHGNAYSQRVIRIYDLADNILYQVWGNDALGSCYWMYTEGLLVFAGDNGQGHVGKLAGIVFAIRPVRDVIERRFLIHDAEHDPQSSLSVAWYKELYPALTDSAGVLQYSLAVQAPWSDDPGTQVILVLRSLDKALGNVCWHLDAKGEIIPGTRVVNDAYRANMERYPPGHPKRPLDPDVFKLMPARDETAENGCSRWLGP